MRIKHIFKLSVKSNPDLVKREAQKSLNTLFEQLNHSKVLFLSSGGSAFEVLGGINHKNLGSDITISVVDERFHPDPYSGNFAQLTQLSFYDVAQVQGCQFIDTRTKQDESLHEVAARYEQSLRLWVTDNPGGVIIATLGIGIDGHTAGIFPMPDTPTRFHTLFERKEQWVIGYDSASSPYPKRVTTTIPLLKFVNYAIVYAVGENKQQAVEKTLVKDGTLAETPARIIRELGNVHFFTDRLAGSTSLTRRVSLP